MNRNRVIVTVAPTGARRTKREHGALPLSTEEIVAAAREPAAGASILHLHVRDDDGMHSLDVGRYREATVRRFGRHPTSASSRVPNAGADFARRHDGPAALARARDDIPNLNELLEPDDESQSAAVRAIFAETAAAGTVPQYIVHDWSQLQPFATLVGRRLVPQRRPFVLLVIGRNGAAPGSPRDVLDYLPVLPGDWRWSVCVRTAGTRLRDPGGAGGRALPGRFRKQHHHRRRPSRCATTPTRWGACARAQRMGSPWHRRPKCARCSE